MERGKGQGCKIGWGVFATDCQSIATDIGKNWNPLKKSHGGRNAAVDGGALTQTLRTVGEEVNRCFGIESAAAVRGRPQANALGAVSPLLSQHSRQ